MILLSPGEEALAMGLPAVQRTMALFIAGAVNAAAPSTGLRLRAKKVIGLNLPRPPGGVSWEIQK